MFRRLNMLEAAGDHSLLALCLSGQAETRLERADLEGASHSLARAQLKAAQAQDDMCRAEVGRIAAELHPREGRTTEAIVTAEISRSIAHRCGAALVAAECAAVSAVGLGREGRTEEATERRKEATLGFGNVEAKWHRDRWLKAWTEASVPDLA